MNNHELGILAAVPHLEQYVGVWAVEERAFTAILERVNQMDLAAHVRENLAKVEAARGAQQALGDGMDAAGSVPVTMTPGGVAVVEVVGALTKYGSSLSTAPATVALRKTVRELKADTAVKGVMLRIESPGGTVAGTMDLAGDIEALAAFKPVWAWIEDIGASGGYLLALPAARIGANANAVIGSIGTFMVLTDSSVAAAKAGVKVLIVKAGEFKGLGQPGTAITDAQVAEVQRTTNQVNELFVNHLQKGRKLAAAAAQKLADGRVHVGKYAQEAGLIDSVGTYDAFLAAMELTLQGGVGGGGDGRNRITPAPGRLTPGGTRMEDAHMSTEVNEQGGQPAAPAPATLKELKAALPDSTAEFREKCLEAGHTLTQAAVAWAAEMSAQVKARDEELKAARAAKPTAGQLPLATKTGKGSEGGASVAAGDAEAAFMSKVKANVEAGMERGQAFSRAVREDPEGHRAYLTAYNARHGRRVEE